MQRGNGEGNGEAEYMNIVDVVDGCDMVFEHDINDWLPEARFSILVRGDAVRTVGWLVSKWAQELICLNDDGGDEAKCIGEFPVGDTMQDMICKDICKGDQK